MAWKNEKNTTSHCQIFSIFLNIKQIGKGNDLCNEKGGHQASMRARPQVNATATRPTVVRKFSWCAR